LTIAEVGIEYSRLKVSLILCTPFRYPVFRPVFINSWQHFQP
jgi:hypothetical protein